MSDNSSLPDWLNTPPSGNTGVNYPQPRPITGENPEDSGSFLPFWGIDWLRLSFPDDRVSFVTDQLIKAGLYPSPSVGKYGYSRGYTFRDDPLSTGDSGVFIWWGGDAMKGRATFDCSGAFAETVFPVLARISVPFSVRRLDLRLDFDGVSFLDGQDAILNVLDHWPYPGIKPKHYKIDDMGQGTGSTLYVGGRQGECMIRWYEKGLQMRDPLRPNWCRFEIELKPKTAMQGNIMWDWLCRGKRQDLASCGFGAAFMPYFTGSETNDKRIIPPEVKLRDFDDRILIMVKQYGGLLGEMLERAGHDWSCVAGMLQSAMERSRFPSEYLEARAKANLAGDFLENEIPY